MNRNDRSIVTLVMVAHSMVHTYELSIPILVGIWLSQFGVTAATMGVVVTAGYALFGLGAIPGGVLADAIGSRSLIVACLAGMSVSFLLLSASPTLPVIALALLVWGASASVYHPSGLSLISTGVRERGSAFAYHGIAGNLGIAFGPLATTVLLLFFDWRYVTAILAIPAALAALFALQVNFDEKAAVEATDGGESKADAGVSSLAEFVAESKVLFAGAFVFVFGVVILSGLYYRGVLTFLPVVLSQFDLFQPVEVAGRTLEPYRYFYAGLLMVGVFGQYTGGKLTDRIPTEYGIAVAFAVLAVLALAFLPASNAGLGAFLVVGGLLGFFLFVVQPLYQATVAEYTPAGTRGLSYGYTYLGVFGVGSLGATIAGGLLSVSASALFLALAGFATAAAGLGAYLSLR
ncbi:MFS transporter [Halobacteriaceae archaeon GCM10025711]